MVDLRAHAGLGIPCTPCGGTRCTVDDLPAGTLTHAAWPGFPVGVPAVVLLRVDDVAQADTPHCVHGKATCAWCGQLCWVGTRSVVEVTAGRRAPICAPCATGHAPPCRAEGTIGDHARADGPHDEMAA